MQGSRKIILNWLVYLFVRVTICIVQAIRIETCDSIARGLAWFMHAKLRFRYDITDENLAHAFPELSPVERDALGRRMWRHMILLICELVHAPQDSSHELDTVREDA